MDLATTSALGKNAQLDRFLAFAWYLTVAAREAYIDGQAPDPSNASLRGVNEIMHQVLQHTRHLLSDDLARYPDDVLEQIILEEAQRAGIHARVEWAWRAALRSSAAAAEQGDEADEGRQR